MSRASDPFGQMVGSVVAIVFGLVFVVANTGELSTGWSVALRAVAVVVAAVLAVRVVGLFRRSAGAAAPGSRPRPRALGRGYWIIVAAEVLALVLGLVLINAVLGAPRFAVAWVALVVGVHFVALGAAWQLRLFSGLGVVMTLLGLLGFVAGALGAGAPAIGLLSGVASGAALFATVAVAVRGSSTPA